MPTSCNAIKIANPNAPDGTYTIDPDGAGYASYWVMNGIATTRFDPPNWCSALGLQMVVPCTKAHLDQVRNLYGKNAYIQTVPGIYGEAAGN